MRLIKNQSKIWINLLGSFHNAIESLTNIMIKLIYKSRILQIKKPLHLKKE